MRRPALLAALIALLACPAALARPARDHTVSITPPGQFDATLAAVSYAHAAGLSSAAPQAPVGLNYVAIAVPRQRAGAPARALVLVVNHRPRGSMIKDVGPLVMGLRTSRELDVPHVTQRIDLFGRHVRAPRSLCAACGGRADPSFVAAVEGTPPAMSPGPGPS
jgi:hypothetical protein